jgi:hypothetical protein
VIHFLTSPGDERVSYHAVEFITDEMERAVNHHKLHATGMIAPKNPAGVWWQGILGP